MNKPATVIRPRDRAALLYALSSGVVPHVGQHLIQVGRAREIATLVQDLDRMADGGSTFRVVVGDYGAGKTFFLNLIRSVALEKKLVVVSADLNPDRRLHASGGQARSLYAELMRNLATRAKPEGGAMRSVVEKFISQAAEEAEASGSKTESVIRQKLASLTELVNGFDFADVLAAYWKGVQTDDERLKSDAIRWLRGEYTTRTDARAALGVRTIVDDASVYDQLKLMARFVRLAGFSGMLVNLDEMVNLYKLSNTQARNANYEQILRILNDTLQGQCEGLGFVLGGTPDFLMDPRRGLYSYPALQSRLAQNSYATQGLVDFNGPVLRLAALTPEDFYILLQKLRDVHASGLELPNPVPNAGIASFMESAAGQVGDAYFRTPRNTIVKFLQLLSTLEQNPKATWEQLLGGMVIEKDNGANVESTTPSSADDELATFKL